MANQSHYQRPEVSDNSIGEGQAAQSNNSSRALVTTLHYFESSGDLEDDPSPKPNVRLSGDRLRDMVVDLLEHEGPMHRTKII